MTPYYLLLIPYWLLARVWAKGSAGRIVTAAFYLLIGLMTVLILIEIVLFFDVFGYYDKH